MATRKTVPQDDRPAAGRTSVALIGSYVPRRCEAAEVGTTAGCS